MYKYIIAIGGALLGVNSLALGSECSAVADNLVKNCGFETGCFMDWAATTIYMGVENAEVAHSGEYGVKLYPHDTVSWVGQGLETTAGQSYTVSLWLRNLEAPNHLELWWNDELIFEASGLPESDYQQVVIDGVIAPSDSTMFWIGMTNPNGYVYLDDVVVVPSS